MDWNLPVNYTMAQVQAATKAQIVTAINNLLNAYSKQQIVTWLLKNAVTYPDNSSTIYGANKQVESQTNINYDVNTGLQTDKQVTTWTYYSNGDVKVITTQSFDANNNVFGKCVIQHFQDNRQPTTTITGAG
jgi:hypothetical protein